MPTSVHLFRFALPTLPLPAMFILRDLEAIIPALSLGLYIISLPSNLRTAYTLFIEQLFCRLRLRFCVA